MTPPVTWPVRAWVIVAFFVSIIAAASLGFWLVHARLGGAVMLFGSVRMEHTPSPIADTTGGIVARLAVQEGSILNAGAEILTFDTSELEAERALVINDLVRATAEYARYNSETNGQNTITDLMLPDGVPHTAAEAFATQIATQNTAMRAQSDRVIAEIAQLKNIEQTSQQQLAALEREYELAATQRDLLAARIEERAPLIARGLSTADSQATLVQQISVLERQLAGLEQQRAALHAKQSDAALKIDQIRARQRQNVSERLAKATQECASLRTRLAAIDARIAARSLRAPVGGVVQDLTVHNPGAVIGAGAPILRMIPRNHRRIIEAQLPISKIRHAEIGGTARIYISGDPERVEHFAKISKISSDRSIDEQGMPYYATELIFSEPSEKFRAGMQVEIALDVAPRRAISYLLEPVLAPLGRSFEHN